MLEAEVQLRRLLSSY